MFPVFLTLIAIAFFLGIYAFVGIIDNMAIDDLEKRRWNEDINQAIRIGNSK